MYAKLDNLLESFIEVGVPFCDCMVMKDGKTVYRKVLGYKDPEKTKKATGNELYNIYSCSKLITCVAGLMLWEKGAFQLEDELYKYMPEFENMTVLTDDGVKKAKNKITIKQLFNMTAGFSYNLESPMILKCKEETNNRCQTRELMKYLAKEPLLFEPGTRWEYSLCHDVLAALIEVVSGKRFGEFVKENIFDPCGMENSTFLLPDSELSKIVNQYSYNEETKTVMEVDKTIVVYKLGTEYESGGAGCISTVEDYIKMLEALRTFKLLKEDTINFFRKNSLTEEQMQLPWYWVEEGRGYGLGQSCDMDDELSADFEWGGAAGASHYVDIKHGIVVYLGTHILGLGEYSGLKSDLKPIVTELFG